MTWRSVVAGAWLALVGCTGGLSSPPQDASAPAAGGAGSGAGGSGGMPAGVVPADGPAPSEAVNPTFAWRPIDVLPLIATRDLLSVHGTGRADVWAVSVNGDILHYDGRSWQIDAESPILALNSVFALTPSDAWIGAGRGRLFHFDGMTWNLVVAGSPEEGPVRAVWGSARNAVWIGGEFGFANPDLYFWDGTRFDSTKRYGSGVPPNKVRALWGNGSSDIWAVGTDDISHWNGSTWEVARIPHRPADRPFAAVWGSGPEDVWAVGDRVVVHWNGREWRDVMPEGVLAWGKMNGVWGSSARDVWLVGAEGDIFHGDGQSVRRVASGTKAELRAVWGSSASEVWAVGSGPIILRYGPPAR